MVGELIFDGSSDEPRLPYNSHLNNENELSAEIKCLPIPSIQQFPIGCFVWIPESNCHTVARCGVRCCLY
jgi:hypothetical protein